MVALSPFWDSFWWRVRLVVGTLSYTSAMTDVPNPLDTWIEDPSTTPVPKRPPKVALETVDQARAWMCYAAFSGDIEKTAIASIPRPATSTLPGSGFSEAIGTLSRRQALRLRLPFGRR